MIFPSKMFSYEESVMFKFSIVLDALFEPQSAQRLYRMTAESFSSIVEYIDVLDCLYALNKIYFNEKGELMRSASGN